MPLEEDYKEVRVTLLPLPPSATSEMKDKHIENTIQRLNLAINPPKTEFSNAEIPKRKRARDEIAILQDIASK
jgi:hypothetical protein